MSVHVIDIKKFLAPDRFSRRLLLGFVVLIALTTLSAGVPAFWLTRNQLAHQAWTQVDNAQNATRSLLGAEQERLASQLALFAERPTLRRLAGAEGSAAALTLYLEDFQRRSSLDLLMLCAAGAPPVTAGSALAECPSAAQQGFTLLDGRPALVAQLPVIDNNSGDLLGTAVAGLWLEEPFLSRLTRATGVEQSILGPDGTRLATSFAAQTISAPAVGRGAISADGRTYYAADRPLPAAPDQPALSFEVALGVDDLIATERRAFSILALSTLSVALLGSALSFLLVRQLNAPLQRLTATAEKISQGDLSAPIPLFTDPLEIKTLAAALQRSQASMLDALHERSEIGERLNALLQSIVEGVVTIDPGGHVTFWSEGARNLLGWPAAEALGRPVNELFPLAAAAESQFLEQIPANGQKKQISILTRAQEPMVLDLTGSQLRPPGSDTTQIALVFRDVTAEEAARRLRSYFLANISHEFRTPLSTLIASVELLLDESQAFTLDETRQLLKPTHLSLTSLQNLIDNLLESSSIEAGQFILRTRPFPIQEAVDNALNIARPLLERRGQPFSVAEPPHLALVQGDPARITQVLVNLIINASKYSPIGGPIELQLAQQTDTLRVSVSDRGPGIPPAERDKSLSQFCAPGHGRSRTGRRRPGSLCRQDHRRSAWRPGRRAGTAAGGSLFWFELPLAS